MRGLYKSASFAVQAIAFRQTGTYIRQQNVLLQAAAYDEQRIVSTFLHLKNSGSVDFAPMSEALFAWSQKWITGIGSIPS